MSSETSASIVGGGISFFGLLGVLFIGLKLGGVIDWSWWWITSPLWLPWSVLGVVLIMIGVFLLLP